MSIRYRAITSAKDAEGNLTFSGKTCGVKFEEGEAMFDDLTLRKSKLGRTAEEIADSMEKDFGYQVIRMHDDGTPLTAEELKKLNSEKKTAPLKTEDEGQKTKVKAQKAEAVAE